MDYTRTLRFQQASEETDVQADTGTKLTKTMTIPEGDETVKGMCAYLLVFIFIYCFLRTFPVFKLLKVLMKS